MNGVFEKMFYAVAPRRCEICGDVVELDRRRCEECEALKLIEGKICNKCGREIKHCECSRNNFSPNYKAFCAPYYFKDSTKKAVYRLKKHGFFQLVPAMSESIVQAVNMRFSDVEFDVVTFVPYDVVKRIKREYNHSFLLAKAVANRLGVPCEKLLNKKRITRSQRKSTPQQRRVNLYNAFSVAKNQNISGKTILIVDDVKTTGTTLSELAFALKDSGAKEVYATAFTVTDKKQGRSNEK